MNLKKIVNIILIPTNGIKIFMTILLGFLSFNLIAQSKLEFLKKITPIDREAEDQLGWKIDSDNKFLIAGVPFASYKKEQQYVKKTGTVYSYKITKDGLKLHQKLFAPQPKEHSSFGNAIALHNDLLVVGDPLFKIENENKIKTEGAIFIYRLINNKWEFEQQILNPNNTQIKKGRFGYVVDVFDNFIVAGTGWHRSYVCLLKYKNLSWKITDSLVRIDTTFGTDVSIFEKTVAIGSKNFTKKEGEVSKIGKVYIYNIDENDRFKLQKSIVPILEKDNDKGFGSAVKLYDSTLIVGAATNYPQKKSGAVYIYDINRKNNNCYLNTFLESNNPSADDFFGSSFDTFQNVLVVGAMGNNKYKELVGEYIGAIYIYEKVNKKWVLQQKKYATEPSIWDKYGFSITMSNSLVFVGCRFDNEDENEQNYLDNAGSIYQYKMINK